MNRPTNLVAKIECICGRCECVTAWGKYQMGGVGLANLRCPVCGVIGWMHIERVLLVEEGRFLPTLVRVK